MCIFSDPTPFPISTIPTSDPIPNNTAADNSTAPQNTSAINPIQEDLTLASSTDPTTDVPTSVTMNMVFIIVLSQI